MVAWIAFSAGCCYDPTSFNVPDATLKYCHFKEHSGFSPNPENVGKWMSVSDGSDYRVRVGTSLLLHAIRNCPSSQVLAFSSIYLNSYTDLLSGEIGKTLRVSQIGRRGDLLGVTREIVTANELSKGLYYHVMTEYVLDDGKPDSRFFWLVSEMRKVRRYSYREVTGHAPTEAWEMNIW
jgi:hypothetical protein